MESSCLDADDDNSKHLLSLWSLPGTFPSSWHVLTHLGLTKPPLYYKYIFVSVLQLRKLNEREVQVIQPASGKADTETQAPSRLIVLIQHKQFEAGLVSLGPASGLPWAHAAWRTGLWSPIAVCSGHQLFYLLSQCWPFTLFRAEPSNTNLSRGGKAADWLAFLRHRERAINSHEGSLFPWPTQASVCLRWKLSYLSWTSTAKIKRLENMRSVATGPKDIF